MAQPRVYANAAERQAAYRVRHPRPTQARLAAQARSLAHVVRAAARAGDPLALALTGGRDDEIMDRVIRHFAVLAPEAEPEEV